MSDFKVGEIAIIQNANRTALNGTECKVISGLDKYVIRSPGIMRVGYIVTLANDEEFFARPHQLRRKLPPSDLDSWAADKIRSIVQFDPTRVTS